MSKYEQPISNLSSLPGVCLFLLSQLTFYILTLFLFQVSQSIFQPSYNLPHLLFFRHFFFPQPRWNVQPADTEPFCVSSKCFYQSPVSVSVAFQVRRCAPLTWSSWLLCLMEGLRSRNHQSLFGRLFQMKSSQNQGADGGNQFVHLCSSCYQRMIRGIKLRCKVLFWSQSWP